MNNKKLLNYMQDLLQLINEAELEEGKDYLTEDLIDNVHSLSSIFKAYLDFQYYPDGVAKITEKLKNKS